jgi:hypothetical protein
MTLGALLRRVGVALLAPLCLSLSSGAALAGPAQFVIININAPDIGLNDPTPAAPVGGNPGTTLGEQRLNAVKKAAEIWSARLDSNVPIRIRTQFTPLGAGVLGSAGPRTVYRDFAGALLPGTWYHSALAKKLAGVDLNPSPAGDDINVNFSSSFNFYLGLDNKAPPGQPDLVTVLLHEFAHGLGFSQLASLTTGALFAGFPDHYNTRLYDTLLGKTWPQMTNAERAASAQRWGRVVWNGALVTSGAPSMLLFGSPEARATSPAGIAGPYQFGTAAFGPALGQPDVTAAVVAAVDEANASGPTTTDGCSAIVNDIAGKVVFIERGTCGFALKARNASAAGAAAVVIYNNAANAAAAPPSMAGNGVDDAFVTAPTVSLRRADGLAILAQVGAVPTPATMFIGSDEAIRAGTDTSGKVRMYAPSPVVSGSSISHFDTLAFNNLLMEPSINSDLTHNVKPPFDLTLPLLQDVGWAEPDRDGDGFPDDEDCNPDSDTRPTVVIGGVDTGVPNSGFGNGCFAADLLADLKAASTPNHGAYVAAVAQLTNSWVASGLYTGREKGSIENAAARYK